LSTEPNRAQNQGEGSIPTLPRKHWPPIKHNSKAVHRAYAKKAVVKVPSLEEYEAAHKQKTLVKVEFKKTA
jgi:hypothetical protein